MVNYLFAVYIRFLLDAFSANHVFYFAVTMSFEFFLVYFQEK